jgi:hypothetical protein
LVDLAGAPLAVALQAGLERLAGRVKIIKPVKALEVSSSTTS